MIACAFTGHRPKSFPWKYDEASPDCIALKIVLEDQIHKLADRGVTDFYSGLALGVDTWAAQIILSFRSKNPALKLHCILPCQSQAEKWETAAQETYNEIKKQADSVVCLSHE